MKKLIRLLALDLDGTTLNSEGRLSDFNREALLKAHEAGIHIVVASGRAFASLPGLCFLAEYLGILREETAAFGNAENDMDMMCWAGIGVAVANAPRNVREAADEITGTNDEDGVGHWIEAYRRVSLP